MGLEDTKTIDVVKLSADASRVFLIAVDGRSWPDEAEAGAEHLYLLQEKVNAYLAYLESGQFARDYPDHAAKPVTIQVYGKTDRPRYAVRFYDAVRPVVEGAGFGFEFILRD